MNIPMNMEENSLSYKTLRNISYNFAGFVLPIVFSIFVTPVIVHKIGAVDFGVYVLANTVAVFLSLADLGLSIALIKFVSSYHATGDSASTQRLVSSANSLYWIIGLVGFAVYAIIGRWLLPYFHVGQASLNHILIVFLLAGANFFINSACAVYLAVSQALQRYDLINKINLSQNLLLNLFMLAAVLLGYKLKAIMLINLVFSLLSATAFFLVVRKILPEAKINFGWNSEEIKKAYKFGILAAVANFSVNALAYLDRLIIPIFTNPAQLTYYSLPGNVAQKTSGVTNSLAGLLFPIASALEGKGDTETLRRVYVRALRNLTVISAGLTMAISLFAYKILYFWVGQTYADKGAGILVILALTSFISSLYSPLYNFVLGLGRVKFLIGSTAGMAVFNLALLFVMVPRFGITGAAWAYFISVLPVFYFFFYVEKHFLQLHDRAMYYLKLYAKIIATSLIYFIIVKFLILPWVNMFAAIVVVGPSAVLLYFALYYLFGFLEEEDKITFKAFFFKFFRLKQQAK